MKTIRYILIILLLTVAGRICAQQEIFDKYADMKGVTTVYVSNAMMNMRSDGNSAPLHINGANKKLRSKIGSILIMTTEKTSIMNLIMKDVAAYRKAHASELLMRVQDDGETTQFFGSRKGDIISDFFMVTQESDELTLISMPGKYDINDFDELRSLSGKK